MSHPSAAPSLEVSSSLKTALRDVSEFVRDWKASLKNNDDGLDLPDTPETDRLKTVLNDLQNGVHAHQTKLTDDDIPQVLDAVQSLTDLDGIDMESAYETLLVILGMINEVAKGLNAVTRFPRIAVLIVTIKSRPEAAEVLEGTCLAEEELTTEPSN